MAIRISIALATYNGAPYIQAQLDSFIAQTIRPDELIISDDCSSDATLEIVERFAQIAPFEVRIIRNEQKLGYAQNFSKSMLSCSGDIVFLSDQDDVWLSTKIEKMINRFKVEPELQLLIHDLEFCKSDLTPIGQTKIERMEPVFNLEREYVVGMATAVRGEFLKLCLAIPSDDRVTHDKWLHDCAGIVGRKGIMREVLALYRRHSSNATTENIVNVDFVTTPHHFSFKQVVKNRPSVLEPNPIYLLKWLRTNQDVLLAKFGISNELIKNKDSILVKRVESLRRRSHLLNQSRPRRLIPICKLYYFGGYVNYNGWRSALKDLLLN